MRVVLTKLARFPLALALLAGCSPEPAPAPTTPPPPAPRGPGLGPGGGAFSRGSGEVAFSSGSEQVVAYLARPKGQGPFPALVVIHEWWGLNPQIRGMADQLSRQGYLSLAVDLYRGKQTDNPEQAHELMRGLPEDRALRDLAAAFAYLKTSPEVKPDRIGSIGWCMGGGYSIKLAVAEPTLAACAAYYGPLPTERESLAALKGPGLGFFGDKDEGIHEASVLAFTPSLGDLGRTGWVHVDR